MIGGRRQLEARLRAVGQTPRAIMRTLGRSAIREQKKLVPRKTRNLGRTIRLERVTSTSALTVSSAVYAAAVEFGTKPHIIRPRRARVLRFPASGTAVTLSGRARTAAAKKPGAYAFARVVHHPGTKPQPFMLPGARKALEASSVHDLVVRAWNDAA